MSRLAGTEDGPARPTVDDEQHARSAEEADAYARVSRAHINAGAYDLAVGAAERSLTLQTTAGGYEALARALWGDAHLFELPRDVRARLEDALNRAVDLPDCSLDGFSDWESVTGHIHGQERRVEVLARAVAAYPSVPAFRLALALELPHERAPALTPLDVLWPLLGRLPAGRHERVGLANQLLRAGEPAKALEVVNAFGPLPDDATAVQRAFDAATTTLFRARCLAATGQHKAAATAFVAAADAATALEGNRSMRVVARFGEAAAHLASGRTGSAIMAVGHALDAWYEEGCNADLVVYGALHEDASGFPETPAEIEEVAAHFCEGAGVGRIGGHHLGRLSWMLLVARHGDGGATLSEADAHLVDQARQLAPSPHHGRRLVNYLLGLGRYPEGVRLALDCAVDETLARLTQRPADGEDDELEAERDAEARRVRVWRLPKTEDIPPGLRLALHRESLAALSAGRTRAAALVAEQARREEAVGGREHVTIDPRDTMHAVFSGWYADRWRAALWAGKHWVELAEAAEAVAQLDDDRQDGLAWFDLGYARAELGDADGAEAAYREDLRVREFHGTHNNLALLLEQAGRLDEAAAHVRRAIVLDPTKDRTAWLTRLEKLARAVRERDDFHRTAPSRWPQVERQGQSVLAALVQVTSFGGFAHLGQLAGMPEEWAARHYKKLVRLGMVLEDDAGRWEVNPHVLPLLERERSHSVATQVIRADETIHYKPIFDSRAEYTVYQILTTLFPNQLVFPNMALSAVFQFDRMKEALDGDTFGYFLRSRVDFCITHTGTYYPIIAFELDSRWHDDPKQQAKDAQKNRIFQIGGVPLLRLRPHGSPTPERIRGDIIAAVAGCGQLLATNEKLAARLGDLDLDRFLALARGTGPTPRSGSGVADAPAAARADRAARGGEARLGWTLAGDTGADADADPVRGGAEFEEDEEDDALPF